MKKSTWKKADVFPIIAHIIEQAHQQSTRLITVVEIADRVLKNSEGRPHVEAARVLQERKRSLEWIATNMVSWFSKDITTGESDWASAFQRDKVDGRWAYGPVDPVKRRAR